MGMFFLVCAQSRFNDIYCSSGYDDKPMGNDDIGAAAAIEALKITAANNQSGGRPQQGGRPQGGFHPGADAPPARPSAGFASGAQYPSDTGPSAGFPSGAQYSSDTGGRPSGGKPQGRPQQAEEEEEAEADEGPTAKLQAPTGGGGAQDKIVGLFVIL
jgi:hypothetical protein